MQFPELKKKHSHIYKLEHFISQNNVIIEQWIKQQKLSNPPVYSSIDIRNSGFKISPIDTNLFPSGFNNICEISLEKATKYFLKYISSYFPGSQKIGVVSEQFTRNNNYYHHLEALFKSLTNTKLDIRLLTINDYNHYVNNLKIFSFVKYETKI